MVLMDVFRVGDVYHDYPFEDARFRYDKKTEKVFRYFYGKAEREIESSSELYHEAISSGTLITKEEYFRDLAPVLETGEDVYIELPYEEALFRNDKKAGKVYQRYRGQTEKEIAASAALYREALAQGTPITREEYFRH